MHVKKKYAHVEPEMVIIVDCSRVQKEIHALRMRIEEFLKTEFQNIKFSYYFSDKSFWIKTNPYSDEFVKHVADILNGELSDRVDVLIGTGRWNV